jgi:hypothetical protein
MPVPGLTAATSFSFGVLVISCVFTGWLIVDIGDCVSFFCLPSAFSTCFTAIATSSAVIASNLKPNVSFLILFLWN